MLSFGQAVKNSILHLKQHDLTGRSCRSEFWWSYLAFSLAYLACFIVIAIIGSICALISQTFGSIVTGLLILVLSVVTIYVFLIISVRRLHDIDFRGWWLLLSLIPTIGAIAIIVMECLPGTRGPNRFGEDPLGNTLAPQNFAPAPQGTQFAQAPQGAQFAQAPQAPQGTQFAQAPQAPQGDQFAQAPQTPAAPAQNPQNPQQ